MPSVRAEYIPQQAGLDVRLELNADRRKIAHDLFITPDSGGKDLFVHFSEIKGSGFKTLSESQRVQFEVTQGQKGLQASNIRPA